MIGLFDSGLGGIATLQEIRKINPYIDIAFYADTKNAPYGTKRRDELVELAKRDIQILNDAGCEKILIACCTASTVYGELSDEEQRIAIPIINSTAEAAKAITKNKKIGVIGTHRTIASDAFKRALRREGRFEIYQKETQFLVSLTEGGCNDNCISNREFRLIYDELKEFKTKNIDTLILGCTHFSLLKRVIEECLPTVRTVSSAECGAREILGCREYKNECGRNIFLS